MGVVVLQVPDLDRVVDRVQWHLVPDLPSLGGESDLTVLEVVSMLLMLHLGLEHEAAIEQNAPVLDFIYMDDLTELITTIINLPLVRIVRARPILRVEAHDRWGTLAFFH